MKRRCHPAIAMLAMAMPIAAAGCGESDGLPRQRVSGSVTLDGDPLSGAWIEFRPAAPGSVTAGGATIEGGRYEIPRDQGLMPGPYRVVITKAAPPEGAAPAPATVAVKKARAGKAAVAGPGPFGFARQLIPARYNVRSELNATVEEGKPNSFDFPLASK